jgi:hypothetical protein
MAQDTEPTNVSFYLATYKTDEFDKQPYEEVVAVFVDEKYYSEDNIGYGGLTKEDIESVFTGYVHLGQHTSISKFFIAKNCKKATQEQYQELFNELESIGYKLNVV